MTGQDVGNTPKYIKIVKSCKWQDVVETHECTCLELIQNLEEEIFYK